ncbi:MAG TPA: hypothetical protein DEE98_08730 [Elusimicrobia bacterium]|nr:MAG: hypothetical protein A2204_04520 [Elusimicrobia bacterium RIFOXYA1_FULL_47_7]OGS10843.1 MAG: hypothetical protein A2386_03005 [Elusimicrobia bacterium RIFOXYB1_FULL_48_9]OGS15690.1 MAG: hypothetical protein A2251_08350 [Elusimicrobia bacterium RIFOXYA2_FULL_47_53]OGS27091.1 MAG: hypothetical protein A2339_01270 [Elusimicrobia bacterium RIFOXYB12_FULL_50_12]OGS30991.1 MAG: hypothetical protein A2323_06670 [Elusimicrobia bacterium RIFOXYB2_FULL_46_23]HBU70446.1 hypothetical protein [Elus
MKISYYKSASVRFLVLVVSIIPFSFPLTASQSSVPAYSNQTALLAPSAEYFAVSKVEPKVFSPDETDLSFSRVKITVDNPNYSEISSAIYNIDGESIKDSLPRETETVLYWDGKDRDGNIVSSGVYFYQIEADGKIFSGSVVVAR